MRVVFLILHKLEDELHTVAVDEGAVFVEQVEVDLLGSLPLCLLREHYFAVEVFEHTLGNGDEAHGAAVDDSRLLQDGEHFGREAESLFHLGDIHRHKLLDRGRPDDLAPDVLDSLACHREDRALNGINHRAVRHAVAADERVAQLAHSHHGAAGKLEVEALEELGEDHSRVSSCAQQHSLAELL